LETDGPIGPPLNAVSEMDGPVGLPLSAILL